ncbi:TIGR03943 family protein [Actinoplanes sp. TFC3]|uniref:TIGR03943 family putative permease subunit n=1 Tax=Actinoplanes sp. TFC3 TaxID=1710355 RepID=UPI00082D1831|nr:TIGR03943 family protein [Actinoplanes sp. TFC3]
MNRQAQAVIMLLLGGAVLRASIGDLYLRYVKEGLRPFLIGAGILLVAAAVMTLWYELRPRPKPEPVGAHLADAETAGTTEPALADAVQRPHDEPGPEHGHEHHHEPRIGWLLILPVLGLLLVSPPALGSYAAGQAGSVLTSQNSASDYAALPAGDPVDVALLDYASRAVFDDGRSLTGRNLRLTGFVTPGPDGQPMLARMVLSCCAADGRPIKVGLLGDGPAGVAADTWVQVVGTYSGKVGKDPVNNADVPYLQVTGWQEITPPKQQYE